MTAATEYREPLLAAFTGGPMDSARWIYNVDEDVKSLDPDVTWMARPEPRSWPLPDTILGEGGFYRKETQSSLTMQGPTSHVIRGAHYVWVGGELS